MVQEKTPQRTGHSLQVPEIGVQLFDVGLIKVAGQDLNIQYGLSDGLVYRVHFDLFHWSISLSTAGWLGSYNRYGNH
jgi:hypothetical protein